MDESFRAQLAVLTGGRAHREAAGEPTVGPFDELVAGLVAKDAVAAKRAWVQFAPLVFRVLRRILGSFDVEDVAQEVFLRVFDRIGTLRDPQALPAFVLSFATLTARWELRKRKLRRIVNLDDESYISPSVHPDPQAREALAAFYRVLDGLKATDRAVFVLRFMEGLEVKVIAETLHVSESTAKRRIVHALERVRAGVKRHPALSDYANVGFMMGGQGDGHA